MNISDVLAILNPDLYGANKSQPDGLRLGTIPSDHVSGDPKILFDSETTAANINYKYLGSYTPTANDRVILAKVGTGWVIVGKIN